jgi:hypothetical protein
MPKATRNQGLGKLKGVFQERKSRIDAAVDADTGYKPKSGGGGSKVTPKASKFPSKKRR